MDFDLRKFEENLVLMEDESELVSIPVEDWKEDSLNPELSLVGRLLTSKSVHFDAFCSTVTKVMGLRRGLEIKRLAAGRLLFIFNHSRDKEKAIQGCPWAFDKHILVLSCIEQNQDPLLIDLNHCEFYIQARGLPANKMTKELAKIIGNKVGVFKEVEVDSQGRCRMDYLRIKVSIDVTKPLLRQVRLVSPLSDVFNVQLQYERLPNFCYLCGMLGHVLKECELQYKEDFNPNQSLPFGPWLRASSPSHRFWSFPTMLTGNLNASNSPTLACSSWSSSKLPEREVPARGGSVFGNFQKFSSRTESHGGFLPHENPKNLGHISPHDLPHKTLSESNSQRHGKLIENLDSPLTDETISPLAKDCRPYSQPVTTNILDQKTQPICVYCDQNQAQIIPPQPTKPPISEPILKSPSVSNHVIPSPPENPINQTITHCPSLLSIADIKSPTHTLKSSSITADKSIPSNTTPSTLPLATTHPLVDTANVLSTISPDSSTAPTGVKSIQLPSILKEDLARFGDHIEVPFTTGPGSQANMLFKEPRGTKRDHGDLQSKERKRIAHRKKQGNSNGEPNLFDIPVRSAKKLKSGLVQDDQNVLSLSAEAVVQPRREP